MLNLKHFFELVKAQQKPYETALISAMQDKVDWIKKYNTYDLNQRQKEALERDKALVVVTENYVTVQHKIITSLFSQLEQAQTEAAAHFADKLKAEQALRDLIQKNYERSIQPAA